jgi:uncharacterized protein (TIGR02147 family)
MEPVMQTESLNEHYRDILATILSDKKNANSSYSLRAFARDLDLNQGVLSQILNGKRNLSIEKAQGLVEKMPVNEEVKNLFLQSVYECNTHNFERNKRKAKKIMDTESELASKAIEKWQYLAIMNVLKIDRFQNTIQHIAKRLNFSEKDCREYLNDLVSLEYIFEKDGVYFRSTSALRTTYDIPSESIKKAHIERMQLASKKMYEVDIDKREFISHTMLVSPLKIKMAKKLIREFLHDFDQAVDEQSNEMEVYQFNMQFFPLSQKPTP